MQGNLPHLTARELKEGPWQSSGWDCALNAGAWVPSLIQELDSAYATTKDQRSHLPQLRPSITK